jgi:SAM-dependent methyltransferase
MVLLGFFLSKTSSLRSLEHSLSHDYPILCSVEVLDVTEEFCRAGEMLTTRTGLGDLVTFRHASALDMPHPDASFDTVCMQHSSMNIADKERLYTEIHRVLRPAGHLALHEIMAGPVAPIHFPVPWARGPEISFSRRPEEVRALITGIGFGESAWINETASALRWFRERLAAANAASGEVPPLGLHLVLGADLGQMFRNLARNLQIDLAREGSRRAAQPPPPTRAPASRAPHRPSGQALESHPYRGYGTDLLGRDPAR